MDVGSQETPSYDFGFAFDQVRFSDSVLRIEIIPDPSGSGAETDDSLADRTRNLKRRRDDEQITINDETTELCKENDVNGSVVDLVDIVGCEYEEDGATTIAKEPPEDLENSPDLIGQETVEQEPETSTIVEVKTVHINSLFLAVKSPFFYKLISNEKRDSEPRHVTLQIRASEEEALMDLLNFIYINTLRSTTPTALVNVLMAADKYEVASCVKYCSQLLQNSPMSCESALVYLNLPSKIRMVDAVRSLRDAARKFLITRFANMNMRQSLDLSLSDFEAFLMLDYLELASEDWIYKLILTWAEKNYPKLQDRREILSTRLLRYVRFPYLTCRRLKDVLSRPDIEPSLASEYVLNALFHKAESPNPTQRRVAEVERPYKLRPIKVVELESPRQQRICYLDLEREECEHLFPSNNFYSAEFDVGGQRFVLFGLCRPENGVHFFGLFLEMRGKKKKKGSASLTVDYEFASRAKPSEDFVSRFRARSTFTSDTRRGCRNLFGVPWTEFIADDSPYFIDGVLHLRAELSLR